MPLRAPGAPALLSPALPRRWRARTTEAARAFLVPGPRMVDELECVASVLLAIAFGHLVGAQNISWAAFSGYMVMRGHVSESLLRGVLRIVGTGVGAAIALALTPLVRGSALASAVALAVVGGVSLYGALTAKRSYAWLFVGLTFVMVLLDKLEHPAHSLGAYALTRMLEVIAGATACVLVSMLSTLSLRRRWPGPPRKPAAGLGWRPEAARHAGQAAVALVALPFLGRAFHIPELAQSAVTIMAVMLIPVTSMGVSGLIPVSRRIVLRVAGCAAGAALSAIFLLLAHAGLAPQAAAPVLIAGTLLGVALGRHIENGQGSIAYAGTQFVLVVLVTLVPDSYLHAEIDPALDRLVGILVGIALLEPVLVGWHIVSPGRRRSPAEPAQDEIGGV